MTSEQRNAAHFESLRRLRVKGITPQSKDFYVLYQRELGQTAAEMSPSLLDERGIAVEAARRATYVTGETRGAKFLAAYTQNVADLRAEAKRQAAAKVAKPAAKPTNVKPSARPLSAQSSTAMYLSAAEQIARTQAENAAQKKVITNVINFPPAGSARRKVHSAVHRAAKSALASGDQRTAKSLLRVCQIFESGAVPEHLAVAYINEMRWKNPKLAKFFDDGPEAA